jgi:hypothetical protein
VNGGNNDIAYVGFGKRSGGGGGGAVVVGTVTWAMKVMERLSGKSSGSWKSGWAC